MGPRLYLIESRKKRKKSPIPLILQKKLAGGTKLFFARKKDIDYIDSLKEILSSEGSCLLPANNLFLAVDQWKTLNYMVDKLEHKKIYKKGAQAPVSYKASKIKLPKRNAVQDKVIYDVVTSIQMTSLVRALTGINHFSVDRCESHLCEEGDFISIDWTKGNFGGSHYVFCLLLDGNYTGGQHVIYKPDREENIYSPKSGDIVISSCDCFHEVKPVMSGERKHVFISIQPLIRIFPDREY